MSRVLRVPGLLIVAVVLAAGLLVAVVPPPSPTLAATVTLGTIQAQHTDHLGRDNGAAGNCITYAPPGTSSSSRS